MILSLSKRLAEVLKKRLLMKCSLIEANRSSNSSDLSEASMDVQKRLMNHDKLNCKNMEWGNAQYITLDYS